MGKSRGAVETRKSAGLMHRSPTATDEERYRPDINQEPVTANRPQTLNKMRAQRECRATPTSKTAHKTSNRASVATVPGQRISSHWSPRCVCDKESERIVKYAQLGFSRRLLTVRKCDMEMPISGRRISLAALVASVTLPCTIFSDTKSLERAVWLDTG